MIINLESVCLSEKLLIRLVLTLAVLFTMLTLPSISYLTAFLLTYSVLASPTPLSRIGTKPQGINAIYLASSNITLGFFLPVGLRDFEGTTVANSRLAIQPKNMFLAIMKLLEEITQGDFNSPLDHPTQRWYGADNFVIVVISVNDRPMPRHFLMWASVRILWTMKHESRVGYHASEFEPSWRGRKVGEIKVVYTRPPPPDRPAEQRDNHQKLGNTIDDESS